MVNNDAVEQFVKAIQQPTMQADMKFSATVSRVDDDGVVWVNIAGSEKETPTANTSAEVGRGDFVNVEWRNNKLYIAGNYSNPSAGTMRVDVIEQAAQVANQAARDAIADAEIAKGSAEQAQASADSALAYANDAEQYASDAQDYAEEALSKANEASGAAESAKEDAKSANDSLADLRSNLSTVVEGATTVEKAVSVMQKAIESVLEYDPTTDTTTQWFWHDADGAHILSDTEGYRNDLDSSGMRIIDISTEDAVAEFGATIARIGKENANNISITSERMSLWSDGSEAAYLDEQRFKSSDIVATNLYMQTTDASTGEIVGQIGWVMRSNGHLSLKLIR